MSNSSSDCDDEFDLDYVNTVSKKVKNLWKSHFLQVENDKQAENIDSSIELEENPQAVSVDTCVTVASHLLNRMENFAIRGICLVLKWKEVEAVMGGSIG